MPFARPSLSDLVARLRADVESRLPGVQPALRRSLVGSLTTAVGGAMHELYGYLDWIARQAYPDTAETAEMERWASIWGISRLAAAAATGSLTATGTVGAQIAAGTVWRRGDGVEYSTDATVILGATGATVAVTARQPGATGDAAAGVTVTLLSPIAGVVSQGLVVAITGGVDVESDEGLRSRLLLRLRSTPRGGSAEDYVGWARAAHADVTRAWARTSATALGTVTVYVMTDDASPTGIPSAGVVAAVAAYIGQRRPVTAAVTVLAPTPVPLDLTIAGITPDSATVRAEVEAEVADLIRRESEPGGTIRVSHIREAISGAAGETDHRLVSPTADVTHTSSQIAVPGAVTWQ